MNIFFVYFVYTNQIYCHFKYRISSRNDSNLGSPACPSFGGLVNIYDRQRRLSISLMLNTLNGICVKRVETSDDNKRNGIRSGREKEAGKDENKSISET